ncbi:MAG: cytochrome b N-terminal domain-containing protein [Candidatus Dormibacteraeota bacterium]|nr:cytochrome b N-terminal domain-containing protein [Candidatus Dormibacteraeota bacterium]
MATLPHPRDIQVAVVDWIDQRFPFTNSVDEALYQRVPNFANAFYYCFGGMVFTLIILQILSGIFLAIYYVPDAASTGGAAPAWTSVQFIMKSVYLGWLVRGVHFWGSNLLVVMIVLHMARVFWTGSYRAPRELNWMVGVIMLICVLAFALTGYLLPWDSKAYWATSVTIQVMGLAPILGGVIRDVATGGPTLGPDTLQRFFTVHVFILPALIVLLMYIHFRLIRQHGISEPM